MIRLNEMLDKLVKANGVQWYEHVLRRDDDDILREALQYEVAGKRNRTIEENMEKANGGENWEDWFEEGRCL